MRQIKGLPLLILLTVLLFFPTMALASSYPSSKGYVNDFAGLMEIETKDKLVQLTKDLEAKTGAELAVVSVKNLGGKDIETYSNELFRQWKIGKTKKDNGVLLLVALKEKKVRIEVGYGLEGVLPDGKTGRILDQRVIPYFKENKYGQGLYAGAQAIAAEIYREAQVNPPDSLKGKELATEEEGFTWLDGIIVLLIVMVVTFIAWFRRFWKIDDAEPPRGGSGWGGGSPGGGGFGGGSSGGGGSSRGW